MMEEQRRASISKGRSYEEIGAHWDTHDAGEMVGNQEPLEVEVDLERAIAPEGRRHLARGESPWKTE